MIATPKIAHCTQLPRIQTRGFVKMFVNAMMKKKSTHLYDATLIGNTMESIYATTDQMSRYEAVKSNMVSVDYIGDFTFDHLFRMMNIREDIDERMAMEIAGFVQLYLPQRTFSKVPITVDSVDSTGEPIKKVLEVKLYYAYEADAVQWLIKAFFNKSDLIDETYKQMNAMVTPYSVLDGSRGENPVINTLFFGNDEAANVHNHLSFQSEMTTVRFPVMFDIFRPTDMMISGYPVYGCSGIYTMYINRFTSAFTYCS
jgi:hypothetical protein